MQKTVGRKENSGLQQQDKGKINTARKKEGGLKLERRGATTSTMVYQGDKENGTWDRDRDVCHRGWVLRLADVEKSL